ncbi:hypothetical protein HPB48_026810 [Haemaphysalis longicornis]|uniref:Uncharacterized protein n=1 Tax=Haemaphysalis longicornis TaxID=44386 RepID=A0A9J6HAP5_HAELO|nr:hypothetical protein HPB48_026810 [Haemaphysalis longicornis]
MVECTVELMGYRSPTLSSDLHHHDGGVDVYTKCNMTDPFVTTNVSEAPNVKKNARAVVALNVLKIVTVYLCLNTSQTHVQSCRVEVMHTQQAQIEKTLQRPTWT